MSIFSFDNYRDVIRHQMDSNAHVRGYQGMLAKSGGFSSSYLSQVLKGPVQLTPDQAFSLCEFWKLDDLSTSFFLTLVNLERAGTSRLKARLQREIENLRFESKSSLSKINHAGINARKLNREDALAYWSQWHIPAVREALFISGVDTAELISARLSLPLPLVERTLLRLEEMGLTKRRSEDRWQPMGEDVVEQDDDLLISLFHGALRQKTIANLGFGRKPLDVAYSWIDSVSKDDIIQIRELLRDFLRRKAEVIKDSPKEELVVLCVDFFRL